LLLLAYTSVPQITEKGNKLTLRIPPDFMTYIEPFIRYEMAKKGKNVGMANADHDYAKAWVAAFKPAWDQGGRHRRRQEPDVATTRRPTSTAA
jgi:branched-chain amino acid transport system substrate-binding protein